jgi:hypothetical protein
MEPAIAAATHRPEKTTRTGLFSGLIEIIAPSHLKRKNAAQPTIKIAQFR